MMTHFFMGMGYEGDHGHSQPWDDMKFREYPDRIVFRRSVPHGGAWPDIVGILQKMQMANYTPYGIFTWRDPRYMALSQVKGHHVANTDEGLDNIAKAVVYMDTAFQEIGWRPTPVRYEAFIANEHYRSALHGLFTTGVGETPFKVYNGNSKYVQDVDTLNAVKLQIIRTKCERSVTLGF
jgi:hypothetical protein